MLRPWRRGPGPIPLGIAVAVAVASCAPGDETVVIHTAAEVTSLEYRVDWGDSIRLEERPGAAVGLPLVRPDRDGYLVADVREPHFRVYDPRGRLVHAFGRHGSAPGEFTRPAGAFRLGEGILAVDTSGRVAIFDSAGGGVVRAARIPVAGVSQAQPLDDSLVLAAGRIPADSSRLHVWNLKSGRLVQSFFVPAVATGPGPAPAGAGVALAAVRGDTVAALYTHSDTVYLFSTAGVPLGQFPLGARYLRLPGSLGPVPPRAGKGRRSGISSFSTLSDLYWLRDGTFLVQYHDETSWGRRWRLLRLSRRGDHLFEVGDPPRLLTPLPDGRGLLFVQPGARLPSSWRFATLRD